MLLVCCVVSEKEHIFLTSGKWINLNMDICNCCFIIRLKSQFHTKTQQSKAQPLSQTRGIDETLSGDGEEDAYYAAPGKINDCCKVSRGNAYKEDVELLKNSKLKNFLSADSVEIMFPEAIRMIAF